MKAYHVSISLYFITQSLLVGCVTRNMSQVDTTTKYTGTGSVSKGVAETKIKNLFTSGKRVAGVGVIKAIDNSSWTVPAEVRFSDKKFPIAPDLFNPHGSRYGSVSTALAAFNPSDVIEIEPSGETFTAFIFADNYFELYVNGIPVGKDPVPFTQFNSNIVKFKVSKPFTVAMKLVDWEEHLGLGSERNRGVKFHPGDGGMVAVIKDQKQKILAVTGSDWKAQTFYTAPIIDLSCTSENGATRSSSRCLTKGSDNGSAHYGLHWKIPSDWMETDFDDSGWPNATTFTNSTIGVNNKKSYTNFTDIFDDPALDAKFIWSTNVVLDNEVIVRYEVR